MFKSIFLVLFLCVSVFAQSEVLTTADIFEMAKAGLGKEIILKKINNSQGNFDVSAKSLIELKKANITDEIIVLMLEKTEPTAKPQPQAEQNFPENLPAAEVKSADQTLLSVKKSLLFANVDHVYLN